MKQKLAILGCGWLGVALGKHYHKKGWEVKASVRTLEKLKVLEKHGFKSFQINLTPLEIEGDYVKFLANNDVLVIAIPPGLRYLNPESFVEKIALLCHHLSPNQRIIFISSTAVYGASQGLVDEFTTPLPETENGQQILAAERLLQAHCSQATVLRFAGLLGPNRHPIFGLSSKKTIVSGGTPINLIHLEDCIGLIETIIERSFWGKLVCGVSPYQPTKKQFYRAAAKDHGVPEPQFSKNETAEGKQVCSKVVKKALGYVFKRPTLS